MYSAFYSKIIKITRTPLDGIYYLVDVVKDNGQSDIKSSCFAEEVKAFTDYKDAKAFIKNIKTDKTRKDCYFEVVDRATEIIENDLHYYKTIVDCMLGDKNETNN